MIAEATRYPYDAGDTSQTVLWLSVFLGYIWWRVRRGRAPERPEKPPQARWSDRR